MKIILTSVEESLADAWQNYCGDLPDVSVHRGSILEVECDAVVSPANSFGFMDGGIDLVYSRHFGWQVQERLQERIRQKHHGELLVGAAEIVETGSDVIPYVIAAPTMRVPMILKFNPYDRINPYLAARAVLWIVQHGVLECSPKAGEPARDVIRTVAFPGLGTGVGQIDPATCASQVRAAIEDVLLSPPRFPATWLEAQRRHEKLFAIRSTRFMKPE